MSKHHTMCGRDRRKQKELLLERDKKCRYCGSCENLTIDHIIPRSMGGSNKICNLILACYTCNHKRDNRSFAKWIFSCDYKIVSKNLTEEELKKNLKLLRAKKSKMFK